MGKSGIWLLHIYIYIYCCKWECVSMRSKRMELFWTLGNSGIPKKDPFPKQREKKQQPRYIALPVGFRLFREIQTSKKMQHTQVSWSEVWLEWCHSLVVACGWLLDPVLLGLHALLLSVLPMLWASLMLWARHQRTRAQWQSAAATWALDRIHLWNWEQIGVIVKYPWSTHHFSTLCREETS